jgi:hypothetical protein
MCMKVSLSNGKHALVDDEDYELVVQFNWRIQKSCNTFYAQRHVLLNGKRTTQSMHKLITGYDLTDHINGNGLDNQRCNLRRATNLQNLANRISTCGKSKYKGVSWDSENQKWRAQIKHNYKKTYLGLYNDEIDAAMAYDAKAIELFGEFARPNFPIETSL